MKPSQRTSKYILAQQLPNSGCDYPTGRQGHGDTSVTQYACLGLWSAARAGIQIPVTVWDQAIAWHVTTQNPDGGFRYVPGTEEGAERGGSSIILTLAAMGSKLICARHTFSGRADSLAKLLINALDDPELGVLIEARNALCWLARKPNGLGEAAEPLANLPANDTEEKKQAAIAAWHSDLVQKWGTWYLQNRPYADRGDEFEAELLQKIVAAR